MSDYLKWPSSSASNQAKIVPLSTPTFDNVYTKSSFDYLISSNKSTTEKPRQHANVIQKVSVKHYELWPQRHRDDHRLDFINSTAIDELTEWLRPWYVNSACDDDLVDHDNILEELNESPRHPFTY